MKHVREDLPDVQTAAPGGLGQPRVDRRPDDRQGPRAPLPRLRDARSSTSRRRWRSRPRAPGTPPARPPRSCARCPTSARRRLPFRMRRSIPILAVVLVLAAIAAGAAFLLKEGVDRTQRGTGTGHVEPEPGTRVVSLKRTSAEDYDPLGGDGEHPEQAPLAVDKDPGTAWSTERYSDQRADQGRASGSTSTPRPGAVVPTLEIDTPRDRLEGHDLRRPRGAAEVRCPTPAGADVGRRHRCAGRTSASASARAASAIATSSSGSPSCRRTPTASRSPTSTLFQRKPDLRAGVRTRAHRAPRRQRSSA